jgi:predicted ATPase
MELLERGVELEALRSCVAGALGGSGRLVVVEGEPGIGKTELVRAARDEAAREGMRAVACRGTELERELPFGLVRQLFEPALHDASESERSRSRWAKSAASRRRAERPSSCHSLGPR